MTQLNLKLAEIVPEKVVVIDGKQYLILGENKSSTSESTPKRAKGEKRAVFSKEDKQKRRDAIMTIVRENPGLNKQEIIAELEKRFNLVVTSSMWNNTQTALKNDGHLRSEWINDKHPWDGARYYAVSSNASENLKDVDPELERLLDEEEEIERRALSPFGPDNAKSWGVDSDEPDAAEKAYAEFEAQVRTMNMNGVGSVEIARRFGINEITVLDILNRS